MTRKGLARTDGALKEGRTSSTTTSEITVMRTPDARISMVVHSPPMATSKRRPACKKVTTRRVESIRTTRISPICSPTVRISVRPPTLTITTDRLSPTIPVIAIPAPGNPGTFCPGRGGGGSCPGNGGGGSVWPGPGVVNKGMNGSGRPVGPEGTTASLGGFGEGGRVHRPRLQARAGEREAGVPGWLLALREQLAESGSLERAPHLRTIGPPDISRRAAIRLPTHTGSGDSSETVHGLSQLTRPLPSTSRQHKGHRVNIPRELGQLPRIQGDVADSDHPWKVIHSGC